MKVIYSPQLMEEAAFPNSAAPAAMATNQP